MAYYANAPLPDTNARQSAMTIRPPSSAILAIDSEDRYTDYIQAATTPTTPYDFTIAKSENLMAGFFTRLGVTEIVFPWVIPNINSRTNSIVVQYKNGAAAPVTSPVLIEPIGFYTPAEIAARLQSHIIALDASLNTFTMSYGGGGASAFPSNNSAVPTFKYTTGNPLITIAFIPNVPLSAAWPFTASTKQLFNLLGFDYVNSTLAVTGSSLYTLCQAIKYVDIVSSQLTNNQAVKDSMSQSVVRDTLCRLYVADNTGTNQSTISPDDPVFCPVGCAPTTLYRNFTVPKMIQWLPNQNIPGYLTFQVYDDGGNLLSTTAGTPNAYGSMDWQMTLLITEA